MKLSALQNRLSSNQADSNTVSIIVWISITVVLVIAVGATINKAINDKGDLIAKAIAEAGTQGSGVPTP